MISSNCLAKVFRAVYCSSHSRKAAFSVVCCARAASRACSMRCSSALRVMFFTKIVYTKVVFMPRGESQTLPSILSFRRRWLRGCLLGWPFRYNEGNLQGADLVGYAVEDADAEGELAGREVDLLEELEGGLHELGVLVWGEGQVHGLAADGGEVAVRVVGGDVELE